MLPSIMKSEMFANDSPLVVFDILFLTWFFMLTYKHKCLTNNQDLKQQGPPTWSSCKLFLMDFAITKSKWEAGMYVVHIWVKMERVVV